MTWNVNSYTQNKHEKVLEMLQDLDVLFLTETKKSKQVIKSDFQFPNDFTVIINSHNPKQYHGVLMLVRKLFKPLIITSLFSIFPRRDCLDGSGTSGRIITVKLNNGVIIVGTYSPNSGSKKKNLSYRINEWDKNLFTGLNKLRKWSSLNSKETPVIWLGDINVAPTINDISDPIRMANFAGYTLEERTNFRNFLDSGWIDVYRHLNPQETNCYTWIGNRGWENYGMRLDNIIISDTYTNNIESIKIHNDIKKSDHVPLSAIFSF
jgi:exodeoxyribonuclease III